jgi:glycosyltransferase involved in cell wall biosynthesis
MTVGRPVVVTAVGDLPDIVTHYQLGLVARDDAREFASQTVGLFKDSRRREVIGQAARRAAEGEFSWERLTQDLAMLYKQVQNPQR